MRIISYIFNSSLLLCSGATFGQLALMGMGSRRETAEVDAHGASFITITSDAYAECITHGGKSMNVEAKFHSLRQCRMFAKMDACEQPLFSLSLSL